MKNLNELKKEMSEYGISDYFDALKPFAKNSIQITLDIHDDDDTLPIGVSKFGGLPDLPASVEWFRVGKNEIPMSFIAQVNFAEAAPYDLEHKLPERGMLYFFYDCSSDGMPWGFDPADSKGWRVFFYEGELSNLSRREAPEDLLQDENGMVFDAARMYFDSAMELPGHESDLATNLNLPEDDATEDAYFEWLDDMDGELRNKLLGHADLVQGGMELECEYVTHQIYCGTSEGYRIGASLGLDKNAAHWNLLMQVDSNENIGMLWGDVGRLYLWITDEDLASRNFENCWLILQCS